VWADDGLEGVGVPSGRLSGCFDGSFSFFGPHHIEGEATQEKAMFWAP